jgi:uncharacterized phage infection (PIP) family protein YhgE
MISNDELEPAKTPTDAPAEPTLDDLLRMIKETHAETAGLHAAIKEVTAVAKACQLEAERLAGGVEAFVNIMAQVHQKQTTIEDRLNKVESWQQRHDDSDEPDGPSP